MITGVTEGFTKNLELIGTGYRAAKQGDKIVLSLGFSHPIEFHPPQEVTVKSREIIKSQDSGIDKQLVGQVAANIRAYRPPEPYKGKGIRYTDEHVRRKGRKNGQNSCLNNYEIKSSNTSYLNRRLRVRKKISQTPRLSLSVFRSGKHIYAQIIDDNTW